ncbi:MAG: zf-HC2 domain-containing protein [Lachnospiraceae bacterium]|nr:zf-HC2 domain-containing protein [Lachnospiraceae bacterium]
MKSNLKCEIVRDLLPLYVDNLTCEVTNKEIEKHLGECEECKGVENMMRNELINEQKVVLEKEVDYLKKVKVVNKKKNIITIGISALIIISICIALFINTYVIGEEVKNEEVFVYKMDIKDNKVNVVFNTGDDGIKITKFDAEEENGVVNIKVFTAPRLVVKKSDDCLVEYKEEFDCTIKKVYFDKFLIYENGEDIIPIASEMFNAKLEDLSDKKKLDELERILGVGSAYYEVEDSEVIDNEETYGIKYYTRDTGIMPQEDEEIKHDMKLDSYMLLACVEKLDVVYWEYEKDGEVKQYMVTKEDADEAMQGDIKEYGISAGNIQKLYDGLYFDGVE